MIKRYSIRKCAEIMKMCFFQNSMGATYSRFFQPKERPRVHTNTGLLKMNGNRKYLDLSHLSSANAVGFRYDWSNSINFQIVCNSMRYSCSRKIYSTVSNKFQILFKTDYKFVIYSVFWLLIFVVCKASLLRFHAKSADGIGLLHRKIGCQI